MELIFLLVALVPALLLLVAPRKYLELLAAMVAGLVVLCVLWTVSFANSCSSDGCIGVFILGAFTALLGVTSVVACVIRWAMNASRGDKDHPEE
jgi:hypothetical protein